MTSEITRREFLRSSSVAGLGVTLAGLPRIGKGMVNSKIRVLAIGFGRIGNKDLTQVASHSAVEIAGLCDIDTDALAAVSAEYPGAFTCRDYRIAFTDHVDKFDAVIVATPDHSHAPIMLTALENDKHIYGQKPLVHQLEELQLIERAVHAKPHLVTQLGNQRMVYPGRRAAVDILRSGALGKAIVGYVWTGSPGGEFYFNAAHIMSAPSMPPPNVDFDLWLGPCEVRPYREHLLPRVWRSWWDFGTGGLGDWGVHLLDVIFFAYDELTSPIAVKTHAPAPSDTFHTYPCQSTITYSVDSDHFANRQFPIYYNDRGQGPSRASLGLSGDEWADSNMTVVVCEGGVLSLTPEGILEIWRDGQMTPGLEMPGLPDFPQLNHRHAWIDTINGVNTELRTPFSDGVRITEAALLAVKASRFPGQELLWDRASLSFTNHAEATESIVRRDYREGFAPPSFG